MYVTTLSDIAHNTLTKNVLCTLLYYDIFNYPLKKHEIIRFLGSSAADENSVNEVLQKLKTDELIFQFSDLFSVQNNEGNITRRILGNRRAEKYLTLAKKRARLIARFPFVRAVMASGSLSKGYMDDNSDLDFFIVTAPGGLWIARTLLVLYKRLFLFNSHKQFCVNYFVDLEHLEIEEKNLFTATELATLIPLYGSDYYTQLLDKNRWLLDFFPNYRSSSLDGVPATRQNTFKQLIETVMRKIFGVRLNSFFMNVSLLRWKRIYEKKYTSEDFYVAFKTKQYVSKNHPNHYQQKIRDLYTAKVNTFKVKLEIKWV